MKKKTIVLFFLLFIFGFLIMLPCDEQLSCNGPLSNYVGYPLLWFLTLIFLSSFALILNDQKHKFWLKFTGIFFLISMFIVFLTPEYGTGLVSIDRELTNWFFLFLYSFISVIYFIVEYFKNRKEPQV